MNHHTMLRLRAAEMRKDKAAHRQQLKDQRRVAKKACSLSTHMRAAGVDPEVASSVAGALGGVARRLGLNTNETKGRKRMRDEKTREWKIVKLRRYTTEKVREMAANYNPRKEDYKKAMVVVRAHLAM